MNTVGLMQNQPISGQVIQIRRLAQVLGLTREMLLLAEKGEWDQVADREVERREDLAACFADIIPAVDTELVAEALAVLLHLNEELMARLKTARTEVMMLGREHTQALNAVESYQTIGTAS